MSRQAQRYQALIATVLVVMAVSTFLVLPPAASAGEAEGCWFEGEFYSNGACVDTDCSWWANQYCVNGEFQSCGSC